jgi:hypothetical protein
MLTPVAVVGSRRHPQEPASGEAGHDLSLGGEGTRNFPALAVAGAVAQAVSLASAATNREQCQTEASVQGGLTARPSASYYGT